MIARSPPSSCRRRRRASATLSRVPDTWPFSLQAFLAQPARPAGTLTYHELQGFIFAVVSAPELIQPSDWLPIIFNDQDPRYATLEEANAILGQLMSLYNEMNMAVLEQRVALPADCHVRPRVLENLLETAPLAQWSRGFSAGHEWLEELWEADSRTQALVLIGCAIVYVGYQMLKQLCPGAQHSYSKQCFMYFSGPIIYQHNDHGESANVI